MQQTTDDTDHRHALACVREAVANGPGPSATIEEYNRWVQTKPRDERCEYPTGEQLSIHFGWNPLKLEAGASVDDLNITHPWRYITDDDYEWDCENEEGDDAE